MRMNKEQYAQLLLAGFTERQINTMQEKFYTLMNTVALPEPRHLQEIESLRNLLKQAWPLLKYGSMKDDILAVECVERIVEALK